jgi:CHAT domain-containing protein
MMRHSLGHTFVALVAGLLVSGSALADRSTDQIALAANGRFDELERDLEQMEAAGPMNTRDRHVLCYAYSRTKRYQKLLSCLDELAVVSQKGSRRTRLFGLDDVTPAIHVMRAEALIDLGQFSAAIKEAGKASTWFEKNNADDLDFVANALSLISIANSFSGNREKAQAAVAEIVKLPIGQTSSYAAAKAMALARARMALKDYQGVLDAFAENTSYSFNVFFDRLISGSFLNGTNNWLWIELPRAFLIDKALKELGKRDEARKGFDQLLAIRQVESNADIYWQLLFERAQIAESDNAPEDAFAFYEKGALVIQDLRGGINSEAAKIGFNADKQALFVRLVDLAVRLGKQDRALEAIEMSKSRALIDMLASRQLETGKELMLARDDESRARLKQFYEIRAQAAAQLPTNMTDPHAGLRGDKAFMLQVAAFKQQAPEMASLVTGDAVSATELRSEIGKDEALVDFFVAGTRLFTVVATNLQIHSRQVEVPNLEADIRKMRDLLKREMEDDNPESSAAKERIAVSKKIYDQLFLPLEPLIKGRSIVIVPHGPLHYLPFAGLYSGKNYLLDEHSIRMLPSASVERYIRPPQRQRASSILIMGNPDLGNPDYDLPGAEEEARIIARLMPNSTFVSRKAATKTYFRSNAIRFPFIHLASHGQFLADDALNSRLLLAKDGKEDGSLTVAELYEQHLNAELVTLSACQTALGKSMSGDDVIGLTRGFLYAGSSNVIASLWEVDDAATAKLMSAFYTRLRDGKLSKRDALREAQLATRSKYKSPVFWAAFQLIGQGQ